jgi:hypothetical protein
MKRIEITGKKFGRLTVVGVSENRICGKLTYCCICDCGNKKEITAEHLRDGSVKSCGCLNNEMRQERLKSKAIEIGSKFNRLEVIEKTEKVKNGKKIYLCRCDCGSMLYVSGNDLKTGNTKSCGCLKAEMSAFYAKKNS